MGDTINFYIHERTHVRLNHNRSMAIGALFKDSKKYIPCTYTYNEETESFEVTESMVFKKFETCGLFTVIHLENDAEIICRSEQMLLMNDFKTYIPAKDLNKCDKLAAMLWTINMELPYIEKMRKHEITIAEIEHDRKFATPGELYRITVLRGSNFALSAGHGISIFGHI